MPRDPAQQLASGPRQAEGPALEKFNASGASERTLSAFLIIDAGKERSIWVSNGLAPEFVTSRRTLTAAELKEQVASGVKIGLSATNEPLLARSVGLPVKIVASYLGDFTQKVFVKADGPIRTVNDLDGKKIAVSVLNSAMSRAIVYMSTKFGIDPELVPLGNTANLVVALREGRVDAFTSSDGAALRFVDSGEMRILVHVSDVVPRPHSSSVVWATDDLIKQNPDLVRRFVRATMEIAKHLGENPSYTTDLYIRRTNVSRFLADRATGQLDWTPRMSEVELSTAVKNSWQYAKDSGAIPPGATPVKFVDVVDVRFLP